MSESAEATSATNTDNTTTPSSPIDSPKPTTSTNTSNTSSTASTKGSESGSASTTAGSSSSSSSSNKGGGKKFVLPYKSLGKGANELLFKGFSSTVKMEFKRELKSGTVSASGELKNDSKKPVIIKASVDLTNDAALLYPRAEFYIPLFACPCGPGGVPGGVHEGVSPKAPLENVPGLSTAATTAVAPAPTTTTSTTTTSTPTTSTTSTTSTSDTPTTNNNPSEIPIHNPTCECWREPAATQSTLLGLSEARKARTRLPLVLELYGMDYVSSDEGRSGYVESGCVRSTTQRYEKETGGVRITDAVRGVEGDSATVSGSSSSESVSSGSGGGSGRESTCDGAGGENEGFAGMRPRHKGVWLTKLSKNNDNSNNKDKDKGKGKDKGSSSSSSSSKSGKSGGSDDTSGVRETSANANVTGDEVSTATTTTTTTTAAPTTTTSVDTADTPAAAPSMLASTDDNPAASTTTPASPTTDSTTQENARGGKAELPVVARPSVLNGEWAWKNSDETRSVQLAAAARCHGSLTSDTLPAWMYSRPYGRSSRSVDVSARPSAVKLTVAASSKELRGYVTSTVACEPAKSSKVAGTLMGVVRLPKQWVSQLLGSYGLSLPSGIKIDVGLLAKGSYVAKAIRKEGSGGRGGSGESDANDDAVTEMESVDGGDNGGTASARASVDATSTQSGVGEIATSSTGNESECVGWYWSDPNGGPSLFSSVGSVLSRYVSGSTEKVSVEAKAMAHTSTGSVTLSLKDFGRKAQLDYHVKVTKGFQVGVSAALAVPNAASALGLTCSSGSSSSSSGKKRSSDNSSGASSETGVSSDSGECGRVKAGSSKKRRRRGDDASDRSGVEDEDETDTGAGVGVGGVGGGSTVDVAAATATAAHTSSLSGEGGVDVSAVDAGVGGVSSTRAAVPDVDAPATVTSTVHTSTATPAAPAAQSTAEDSTDASELTSSAPTATDNDSNNNNSNNGDSGERGSSSNSRSSRKSDDKRSDRANTKSYTGKSTSGSSSGGTGLTVTVGAQYNLTDATKIKAKVSTSSRASVALTHSLSKSASIAVNTTIDTKSLAVKSWGLTFSLSTGKKYKGASAAVSKTRPPPVVVWTRDGGWLETA